MAAESPDVVAVELVANLGKFDRTVKQSADNFGGSMDQIKRSAVSAEASTGRLSATLGGNTIAVAKFGSTTRVAANDAAIGFNTLTSAAHGNSIAMRETLVLARELAVGNLTRLPGSLSILAQQFAISGKSAGGFATQILSAFGIIKKTVDAEAAAEAAAAIAAADSLRSVAEGAAAKVLAADTEAALARAQIATAATAAEAAAGQEALALAHQTMTAAAGEATIAEVALAEAQGRAAVASEAAAATIATSFGPIGIILLGIATAAGIVFGAFKTMQAQVAGDHTLDDYANSLGLTKKEMRELRKEVGDLSEKEMRDLDARTRAFALTWGDVFNGLKKAASDGLDLGPEWQHFKDGTRNAFKSGLLAAEGFAAGSYGVIVGTFRTIQGFFGPGGTMITGFTNFFRAIENVAIQSWNGIGSGFSATYNAIVDGLNKVTGSHLTHSVFDPAKLVPAAAATGKLAGKSFSQNVAEATAEAQAQIAKNVSVIWDDIIGAAEERISKAADAIKEDRTPKKTKTKKESDHGLSDALAELEAQIKGQWRLAAAYQISDAAVIKATALQRAEEEAIRHKGDAGVFYELELKKAVAERAVDGQKVIADLKAQAAAHKVVNDLVAAGLLPVAQMSDAINLETQKRELLAALAIAQEKGWLDKVKEIRGEIENLIVTERTYTAELSREQALRAIDANRGDIEKLKLESSLMGASNRERAIAIAQFEAMQKLKEMPGLSSKEQSDFVNSATDKAAAGVKSPFEQWAQDIPQTAEAINDALKSVVVDGLNTFNDQLTDAIVNFHSLGSAGRAVLRAVTADLVKMALKQIELRVLGHTLGLAAIGATAAEAAAAGAAWAGPAALASLATLGANAGPAAAAIASTTAIATAVGLPKRDGGPIFGPGGPRDDKVLIRASSGEYMIRAAAVNKIGRSALDHMNLTGEMPFAYALGGVVGKFGGPSNSSVAIRGSAASGSATIDAPSMQRLAQIVGEAARAMPDVKLFPTLDPGHALRAALASPTGQRAFFDFMTDNSGRFKAAAQ